MCSHPSRFIESIEKNENVSPDFVIKKLSFLENLVESEVFAGREGRAMVIDIVTLTLKELMVKRESLGLGVGGLNRSGAEFVFFQRR